MRDVKFSPHSDYQIAAAFDNGCFQLWDRRNPSKPEKIIPSHNGPIFSVDYHAKEHWIATAGRDKFVFNLIVIFNKLYCNSNLNYFQIYKSLEYIRW